MVSTQQIQAVVAAPPTITGMTRTHFLPFFENWDIWSTLSFHHSTSFPVALKRLYIEKNKSKGEETCLQRNSLVWAVRVWAGWGGCLCVNGGLAPRVVRRASPQRSALAYGVRAQTGWGRPARVGPVGSRYQSQCRPRRAHTRRDGLAWGIRAQG